MKIFHKGFNYSQDGAGNRLVYHLQGCNLRCKWCSNPEGMSGDGGENYSADEIVAECVNARSMFFDNGGVTFTGGEATLQFDELAYILKQLRGKKINTAIETNATCRRLKELFADIDELICDYKHYDALILKEYTGADIRLINENMRIISNSGRQAHIRIPIINRVNNKPEGFVAFFKTLNTENMTFEFLPYHEYGKVKWTTEYEITDGFIDDKTINDFCDLFSKAGLKVVKT